MSLVANRLLTRAGNTYSNDLAGNTLTGGGRTNTWDSQNRLVQCVNGTTTSTFKYGSDGMRRQMTSGGTTTDFALDGQSVVRELRAGVTYATYFPGIRGPEYRRDASNNVRWYLYDGLGSIQGEVDGSGNVTASRKFDVYGLVRGSTGTSTSKHKFVGGLGHTSEDETGLVYMRARYYDPQVGRFASEDPAHDDKNWFAYCENNPVNSVDPSGRAEVGSMEWWNFVFKFVAEASSGRFLSRSAAFLLRQWANDLMHEASRLRGQGMEMMAFGYGMDKDIDPELRAMGAELMEEGGKLIGQSVSHRFAAWQLRQVAEMVEDMGGGGSNTGWLE